MDGAACGPLAGCGLSPFVFANMGSCRAGFSESRLSHRLTPAMNIFSKASSVRLQLARGVPHGAAVISHSVTGNIQPNSGTVKPAGVHTQSSPLRIPAASLDLRAGLG